MTQIPQPETRRESYLIAFRFDASLVFANVRTSVTRTGAAWQRPAP